jgi:GT2 family glycosyltransferase
MSAQRPPISVVIPTYAGEKLLQKHLPDVLKQLQPKDEIVVVDDASPLSDGSVAWLQTQVSVFKKNGVRLTIRQHEKNQRFAAAVNTGVSAAQHNLIWLLNNDVSPLTPHSVERAWEWFQNDPNLFSLGCAEVQSDEKDAQKYGRGTGNFQRGLLVHWYDSDQTQTKTLWTAGGSMFADREKFLEIGGMDPLFAPAYEEDRDLSYRALKRGWNIAHEAEIIVHHQHETTNSSVFGQRGIAVASWKNQFLIVWKNISDPVLLLQHIFWLPYHFIVSNSRESGAVWQGFWQAVSRLPRVWEFRAQESRYWHVSDKEILEIFGSHPPKQNEAK